MNNIFIMTEEIESLKRVTDKLEIGGYEYLLTGSMAMSFYAAPRMTRDADILLKLYIKDADKFFELFSDEYYIDKNMLIDSIKNKMLFNILDKKTFFKIDFIFTVRNELEDSMFKRKNKLKINGMEVYVISIEDLIIAKLNWAKESFPELQFRDIRQLMRNNIDKDYLTNWIVKLNLINIYNKI